MKRSFWLTGIGFLFILSSFTWSETVPLRTPADTDEVVITIIYDNYANDPSLGTDWGFAALIEFGKDRLLFDAGRKAKLFQTNLEKLGIEVSGIPGLFISHEHGDHTGGMEWVTEVNPSIRCYLPSAYAADLKSKNRLPENGKGMPEPVHLYGPFYSTGDDFEKFNEQGLVIKTGDGGVLVTGCGHPGVVEMVALAEQSFDMEIHSVIGGLHLLRHSEGDIKAIADNLKKLGVKYICPTHCTGDQSIALLKEAFGSGYIPGGTGKEIVIQ